MMMHGPANVKVTNQWTDFYEIL